VKNAKFKRISTTKVRIEVQVNEARQTQLSSVREKFLN
jgi:hypothetical protein